MRHSQVQDADAYHQDNGRACIRDAVIAGLDQQIHRLGKALGCKHKHPNDACDECRHNRHLKQSDQQDGNQRSEHGQRTGNTLELAGLRNIAHGGGEGKFHTVFLEFHKHQDQRGDERGNQQIDLKTLDLFDLQSENTGKALPVGNVKREARGECH